MKKIIILTLCSLSLQQLLVASTINQENDISNAADLLEHDQKNSAKTINQTIPTIPTMPTMPIQSEPAIEHEPAPAAIHSMPGVSHPKTIPTHDLKLNEPLTPEPTMQKNEPAMPKTNNFALTSHKSVANIPHGLAQDLTKFSQTIDTLNETRTDIWRQVIPHLFASDVPLSFSIMQLQTLLSHDRGVTMAIKSLKTMEEEFNDILQKISQKNFPKVA